MLINSGPIFGGLKGTTLRFSLLRHVRTIGELSLRLNQDGVGIRMAKRYGHIRDHAQRLAVDALCEPGSEFLSRTVLQEPILSLMSAIHQVRS